MDGEGVRVDFGQVSLTDLSGTAKSLLQRTVSRDEPFVLQAGNLAVFLNYFESRPTSRRCLPDYPSLSPIHPLNPNRSKTMSRTATDDPFYEPYDRNDIAYGEIPSAPLAAYLRQVDVRGEALDLGAGAGRDTLALAKAGFHVTAVDLSQRGADRIAQRALKSGVADKVTTRVADVCDHEIAADAFDAICATTVLDHVPADASKAIWKRMTRGLRRGGVLYVEVHSTEDPGSNVSPGLESDAPASETADAVINYFAPNQLACWAVEPTSQLRVLRYEERLEWDYTHGPEHLHGKAILLAVKAGAHPPWYGSPAAFPRRTRT